MAHAERIVYARELAGLARTELARRVSLSVHELRAFETGQKDAPQIALQRIALATGVSLDFLRAPHAPTQFSIEGSHFRARKSLSQRDRLRTLRAGGVLSSFHAACEQDGIAFPIDRLSDFSDAVAGDFSTPEALSIHDIERLAVELRTHWGLGLGPIPNLTQLLEVRGVAVFELGSSVGKDVDAFSVRIRSGRPAIFIGNNPHASRRRFTLAHELGHLVLHQNLGNLEPGHTQLESQANRFAGAFLMPATSYASTARSRTTANALKDIKPMWRTSISAMVTRSYQLGLLTFGQRSAAYRYINGVWRRDEPHEPALEHPVALKKAISLLGENTVSDIAQNTGFNIQYLNELFGTPTPRTSAPHLRPVQS